MKIENDHHYERDEPQTRNNLWQAFKEGHINESNTQQKERDTNVVKVYDCNLIMI